MIIVETMKLFKSYLGDNIENNQKLEELWNALERTDFSFDIRESVRSKIEVACHNLNVDDILSKFYLGEGKIFAQRIADLLGFFLKKSRRNRASELLYVFSNNAWCNRKSCCCGRALYLGYS